MSGRRRRPASVRVRTTAYHEAGHAVALYFHPRAGRVRGLVVGGNRAERQRLQANGLCFSSRTLPPVVGLRVDRQALRDRLAYLLAGGQAEAELAVRTGIARPEPPPRATRRLSARTRQLVARCDEWKARDLIEASLAVRLDELTREGAAQVGPGACQRRIAERVTRRFLAEVKAELRRHERGARRPVRARWPHVAAVAEELLRERELSGERVVEIIEGVEAEQARPRRRRQAAGG